MDDDFDNEMGLPEDELAGGSASDPGDLGLGGMDAEDEMDSEAPGRPSGGARARGSSGSRPRKRAAAAPAARKSASRGAKKKGAGGAKKAGGGAKKKAAKKSSGARKASRKPARKASKKAARGRKKGRPAPLRLAQVQRPLSARYVRAARTTGRSVSAPAVSASSCL